MNKSMSTNVLLMLLVVLGAQTMIVELTIPRLIAPVFGNTLFSWTAIIAVVLTALAAGYHLGGKLSVYANPGRWIYRFSIASSCWVALIAIINEWVLQQLDWAGLMLGPLLASAILAAMPAAVAAAVVPLAVQNVGETSGAASGKCFAWSTLGSILGVLATGYLLLPNLGIFGSLLVGPTLVVAVLLWGRAWAAGAAGVVVLLSMLVFGERDVPPGTLLDKSNGYHRIRVIEGGSGLRYLRLDSTMEGAIQHQSPVPVLNYQRSIQPIAGSVKPLAKALFLGGGSFSMPRYTKHLFPAAEITAVEIDEDVIEVAREYLHLPDTIRVLAGDARQVLADSNGKFDLIVNDAFHGVRKIPFHLVTTEFNNLVRDRLSPHGIYAVNVIGHPVESRLARSMINTLWQGFPHLSLYYLEHLQTTNIWMLASSRPLSIGNQPVPPGDDALLLTDNNAPIEYLIAADLFRPHR